MEKMYIVHEMIGNFSAEVFRSEYWYDVQDYLTEREYNALGYDADDADVENFYSYFSIEEKIITPAPAPSIYVNADSFGEIVGIEKRENVGGITRVR